MIKLFQQRFNESADLLQLILSENRLQSTMKESVSRIVSCFREKNKVMFCGNGGSAADAQHLAAELSGRFYLERKPLPAEALHVNPSYITAVANDYSFEDIYSRYVSGAGKENDVLIGLSTSGNSQNIIRAFQAARDNGITTIGFTGKTGGKLKNHSDLLINVPSENVPRIQEMHLLIGHIICEAVEFELFGEK